MSTSRPFARVRSRLGRLRHGSRPPSDRDPMAQVKVRLDRQLSRLESHGRRLDSQRQQISEVRTTLKKSVGELRDRLTPVEKRDVIREVEHGRLSAQIGAVEQRLGRIEELLSESRLVGAEADAGEAIEVLEAVRSEHEQIRVRMQIISSYEERLRRVEASVIAMYDGDHRHQV